MQPEINYTMIGQRIRTARLQKKLSQAALGSLIGYLNNHISHIEAAQTKVSLSILMWYLFCILHEIFLHSS